MTPREYTYARYLAAKKTVDDRALNQHVVAHVRRRLALEFGPLRVLEVGAGVGTMLARLVEWDVLKQATYVLLDADPDGLRGARTWLEDWAGGRGLTVATDADAFTLRGADVDLRVETVAAELGRFLENRAALPKANLLLANAFLDLVDLRSTLPALLDLLAPNGTYWFSINFDGETIFEPAHAYDEELLSVYHRSMDTRVRHGRKAGDSRTGRHLFGHLRDAGASISAAGGSDWVVHAPDGRYRGDEAHFLHHVVHTVDEELRTSDDVDAAHLGEWVRVRHAQIDTGELAYVAHQLDFAGGRAGEAGSETAEAGAPGESPRATTTPPQGFRRRGPKRATACVAHGRAGS